jgi:hypothetical protein
MTKQKASQPRQKTSGHGNRETVRKPTGHYNTRSIQATIDQSSTIQPRNQSQMSQGLDDIVGGMVVESRDETRLPPVIGREICNPLERQVKFRRETTEEAEDSSNKGWLMEFPEKYWPKEYRPWNSIAI